MIRIPEILLCRSLQNAISVVFLSEGVQKGQLPTIRLYAGIGNCRKLSRTILLPESPRSALKKVSAPHLAIEISHHYHITDTCFNPEGTLLAIATSCGVVFLHNTHDGGYIAEFGENDAIIVGFHDSFWVYPQTGAPYIETVINHSSRWLRATKQIVDRRAHMDRFIPRVAPTRQLSYIDVQHTIGSGIVRVGLNHSCGCCGCCRCYYYSSGSSGSFLRT
jgi:hypothetical protein